MNTLRETATALLVASLGLACLTSAAQTSPPERPAIYVSEFELNDAEGIKPYSARVETTFAAYGGQYIVRGGQPVTYEGAAARRVVMIQFPSMAQAQAWYGSAAYREIIPIRHSAATSRVYIVEGLPR